MPDELNQPNNNPLRGTERTFNSLEKHLTDKMNAIETSLTEKIEAVDSKLTDQIIGVKEFFNAENRSSKEAVHIAMEATNKASDKKERADEDRAKEVLKRLDLIDAAISASGGWNKGVGSSMGTVFQIISSLGVIIGLIVIVMQHR
jgi:hypothetical protein